MTRHFNDPEARAEWSERFGEPEQQGIHETYMRPQPCADVSVPVAEDPDADFLESLTYWPSPEQNNEKESQ